MLVDTNILIYSVRPQYAALRQLIATKVPSYSAISYVESLGFHQITPADKQDLTQLLGGLKMLDITLAVLDQAVALRQQRRMSLGDAIIAATALVHDKTLTRNVADFQWITGLRLLDPLAPTP
jgi:toxin FitB